MGIEKKYIDVLIVPGPSKRKNDNNSDWVGGTDYVKFQIELFNELNTGTDFRWNFGYLESHVESSHMIKNRPNIRNFRFTESELQVKFIDNPSSQHGALLNQLLKKVAHDHSRFIIIIDPDFFIVSKNWAQDLMDFMKDNSVAILGASYPETDCRLYFDFPTAYFSIIDSELLPLDELNYLPDENSIKKSDNTPWKSDLLPNLTGYRRWASKNIYINYLLFIVQSIFRWRSKSTFFRDTGWEMRNKFKNKVKHEEFLFVDNLIFEFQDPNESNLVTGVDINFYRDKYFDIKSNDIDPVFHFHNHGKWEWRQPRAFMQKNEKQYIYYLRPHLKYRILRSIEKIFSSEYAINHKRSYTFKNLLNDHHSKKVEGLFKLPNAKAFYFFRNGFISFHLGHDFKFRNIDEIRLSIKTFISTFQS